MTGFPPWQQPDYHVTLIPGMKSMFRIQSVSTNLLLYWSCPLIAGADQTHNRHLSHNLQDPQRKWSTSTHESGPVSVLGYSPISAATRRTYLPPIVPKQTPAASLPLYIKPLPARIGSDEITYLEKKGALTIPNNALRNELLRAYIEFVHPYMPLLDLHEFIEIVDKGDGSDGKLSLILFQSVMFAGSAFIDMRHLRKAGYLTRKEARKDFFLKTRVSRPPLHTGHVTQSRKDSVLVQGHV